MRAAANGENGGLAPCRPTLSVGREKPMVRPWKWRGATARPLDNSSRKLIPPSRSPLPQSSRRSGTVLWALAGTRARVKFSSLGGHNPRPRKTQTQWRSRGCSPSPRRQAAHDSGRFAGGGGSAARPLHTKLPVPPFANSDSMEKPRPVRARTGRGRRASAGVEAKPCPREGA